MMDHANDVYKIRLINDAPKYISYKELCRELGFDASLNFVEVDDDGKIGFTTGKEWECRHLAAAIRNCGYVPTPGLEAAIRDGRPSYW